MSDARLGAPSSFASILTILPPKSAEIKEVKLTVHPFTTLHPFVDLKDVNKDGNLEIKNLEQIKAAIKKQKPLTEIKEKNVVLGRKDRGGFISHDELKSNHDVVYYRDWIGQLYKVFAAGSFAEIWLVNDGKSWSALKKINADVDLDVSIKEFGFAREAKTADFFAYDESLLMAMVGMPLLSGDSLENHTENTSLPTVQITGYIGSAFEEMQRIHDFRIAHLDIKPGNLIVEDSRKLKLVDFGLSVRLDGQAQFVKTALEGTPYYMAPELVEAYQQPTRVTLNGKKVDVFAMGISVAQICGLWTKSYQSIPAGQYPFQAIKHQAKIVDENGDEAKSSVLDDEAIRTRMIRLCKSMTRPLPADRPELLECKKENAELHEKAKQITIMKVIIDAAEILQLKKEEMASMRRALFLADMVLLVQSRELTMVERTQVMRFINPCREGFDEETGRLTVCYDEAVINVRKDVFAPTSPTNDLKAVIAAIPAFEATTRDDCNAYYVFLTTSTVSLQITTLGDGQVVVMRPEVVLPDKDDQSLSQLKSNGLFRDAIKKAGFKEHQVKKTEEKLSKATVMPACS